MEAPTKCRGFRFSEQHDNTHERISSPYRARGPERRHDRQDGPTLPGLLSEALPNQGPIQATVITRSSLSNPVQPDRVRCFRTRPYAKGIPATWLNSGLPERRGSPDEGECSSSIGTFFTYCAFSTSTPESAELLARSNGQARGRTGRPGPDRGLFKPLGAAASRSRYAAERSFRSSHWKSRVRIPSSPPLKILLAM